MKPKKFTARNITILNLNRRPDRQGDIFPPECYVTFKNPVVVVYEYDYSRVLGKAYLMRVQNTIVADLHIISGIEDDGEAKTLIQQMYPSISARVNERVDKHVFQIEITAVSMGFTENADEFIEPLGRRVVRDRKPVP